MIPTDLALKLSYKENLVVHYRMRGWSYKQTARALGVQEHTASTMFSRARAKAKKLGYDFRLRLVCCE